MEEIGLDLMSGRHWFDHPETMTEAIKKKKIQFDKSLFCEIYLSKLRN